ncbi:hypothetical protein BT63DRAFT_410765 [Microthyrium microscopicum]|uniref:Uncharacterized protein n=1 Tax=Microthyrium microscopicum TaxID=703497 RepID=A0A6A6UQY1_9PEZI|nr:hypothetical protein BT63DRAFT_410765 [Microthyrium microscopicum]
MPYSLASSTATLVRGTFHLSVPRARGQARFWTKIFAFWTIALVITNVLFFLTYATVSFFHAANVNALRAFLGAVVIWCWLGMALGMCACAGMCVGAGGLGCGCCRRRKEQMVDTLPPPVPQHMASVQASQGHRRWTAPSLNRQNIPPPLQTPIYDSFAQATRAQGPPMQNARWSGPGPMVDEVLSPLWDHVRN